MTVATDGVILCLDLGTSLGFAYGRSASSCESGCVNLAPKRHEGAGMRYLKFRQWLASIKGDGFEAVYFEEVRRHAGTSAAHVYGGLMAILTAWCEHHAIPYASVPVSHIKKFATGKGNADKAAMVTAMQVRGFEPINDDEADALALFLLSLRNGRA